jgi:Fe-S cluster assembly protein SufD
MCGLPPACSCSAVGALAAGEDAVRFLGRRYERSEEIFARLNAALADEGVVLRVDEGVQVETPLQLVFASVAGDTDLAWHHRHLIELRAGASLGVVEHRFSVGDSAHLDNTVLHAHVARDAVLKHARVQAGSARQTSFLRTDAVLARDAQYHRVDLELGAALSRHELNVRWKATTPN